MTAQLINVANGYHLWAQKFNRAIEDVFDVQDEIGHAIVEGLKTKLGRDVPKPRSKRYTENLETHELYLRGRYLINKQTEEGVRTAISYFERALSISPKHAAAHVGLADCYALLGWYGVAPAGEVMPKAKEAALEAVRIDDRLSSAHSVLGFVSAQWDWDWGSAEQKFKRALELGRGLVDPHFHYALDYLTPLGQLEEALRHIKVAKELDPLSLIVNTAIGGCYHRMRSYDQAIRSIEETLELDRTFYHGHWSLGRTLEQTGALKEAVIAYRKANDLSGGNASIAAELGHCYGHSGMQEEAKAVLSELDEMSKTKYVSPLSRAIVYLGLGERDTMFGWLEKALQERPRALTWIAIDPRFDTVREDPRFSQILTDMGLRQSDGVAF